MEDGTIRSMFAMLSGAWPRVTADGIDLNGMEAAITAGARPSGSVASVVEGLVKEAVAAQVEAGMGLVTDGHVRWADPAAAVLEAIAARNTGPEGLLVRAWKAVASAVDGLGGTAVAAQALPGPYSLGRGHPGTRAGARDRMDRALGLAAALAGELAALAAAGCRIAIVEEPAAVLIGEDAAERELFVAVQRRLLADVAASPALHPMLAVTGGSAAAAGPGVIFAAPYQSHLFDLVAGPDNWYLVRAAPTSRGVVCAALRVTEGAPVDRLPELVWAAQYAASAGGRGLDRVGLANATLLDGMRPATARTALATLRRAASLAPMPLAEAVAAGLDPRAIHALPRAPGGAHEPGARQRARGRPTGR